MATTSKAASDKGAAARSETSDEPKTIEFRGTKLTLPNEMPATILFDFAELEAAGENPMPVFRMLRALLGGDQFNEVRNLITQQDNLLEVIDKLTDDIFEQYGLTPGE